MRRTAFTIIELLVVIAIIGLLAALLMPALNAARRRAYDATCANNLREMGKALYQFASSGDGYFPGVVSHGAEPGWAIPQTYLMNALSDIIGTNDPAWYCPRYMAAITNAYEDMVSEQRIAYYYWAWDLVQPGNMVYQIDTTSKSNVWIAQGYNTNIAGVVLMTDRFDDMTGGADADRQYHGGRKLEVGMQVPGTFALMAGGTVEKIKPRP